MKKIKNLIKSNYDYFYNLPILGDKVSYFGQFKKFRGKTGNVYQYGYGKEFCFVEFDNGRCSCKHDELLKIEL